MGKLPLWIALLFLSNVLAAEEFRPKLQSGVTDCSKPGLPCTIRDDPDCTLSLGADDTGSYPDSAHGIQVRSAVASPDWSTVPSTSRSNVTITWEPPARRDNLLGFGIRLIKNHAQQFCYVVDVKDATWTMITSTYEIQLDVVLSVGGYDIEVISLPENKKRSLRHRQTAMIGITRKAFDKDKVGCSENAEAVRGCWSTDIIMYSRPCEQTLNVSFAPAPSTYSIRSYTVSLIQHGSFNPDARQDITPEDWRRTAEATLPYTDLPLKNRRIYVIPQDSVCSGNTCRFSESQKFDILKASKEECGVKTDDDDIDNIVATSSSQEIPEGSSGFLAAIIVGSIVFTALIFTIIVIVYKKFFSKKSDANSMRTMSSTLTRTTYSAVSIAESGKPRPKVFLMYSNDHDRHKCLIGMLAMFLKTHCACDVVYDENCQLEIGSMKKGWIVDTMLTSDYILLINSEGTYRKCMDCQHGTTVPSPTDNKFVLGDLFSPALEILLKNWSTISPHLLMVHFPYTLEQYRWLPIHDLKNEKLNYQLLDHINNLYCQIHKVDIRESDLENLPDVEREQEDFKRCDGYALQYVKENPDWFHGGMSSHQFNINSDRLYTAPANVHLPVLKPRVHADDVESIMTGIVHGLLQDSIQKDSGFGPSLNRTEDEDDSLTLAKQKNKVGN